MMMSMQAQTEQTADVRHLTATELDDVNGGFIWIAAFAIGAAVGYGIHKAGEAVGDWFGDDD